MSAAPETEPASTQNPPEETSAKPPSDPSVENNQAEKPASTDQIIYPRNSPDRPSALPAEKSSAMSNMLITLAALALAAAGAWVLIQRRQSGLLAARGQRRLQIEETRPLGGRQYLVVANYDGKKFLLGVTPGRINLLTPLDEPAQPHPEEKP